MNKLSVRNILVQGNALMCITCTGDIKTITDPEKIDWVLKCALPQLTQHPDAVLEIDLDNIQKSTLVDSEGNVIELEPDRIKKGDKVYELDTKNLVKFVSYAEENAYNVTPLIERITNSLDNPMNKESIKDLLTFLGENELPVTVNGNILAFKVVNRTKTPECYTDCHTGLITQNIGDVIEMDPEQVDNNRNIHCSTGLHVCSIAYARNFMSYGGALLLVKVAPEDICSVPTDTSSKVRCSKYQILGEIPSEEVDNIWHKNLNDAPVAKQLIYNAINEKFSGINNRIILHVPTVKTFSNYHTETIGTFTTPEDEQRIAAENLEFVKEKVLKESAIFTVLPYVIMLTEDPDKFDNLDTLTKANAIRTILKVKKTYSWNGLGVTSKVAKRIKRRAKKLGV